MTSTAFILYAGEINGDANPHYLVLDQVLEHDDGDGDNGDDDGDCDDGDNGDGDEDKSSWKEFVFLFYENIDNFVKLLC